MPEADAYNHDAFDRYLSAEVILPAGGSLLRGRVTSRKRDTENNRGLRWKLHILGVPINESSYVFCDNMSVVCNTKLHQSPL
jgi:hypothetical protein